MMRVIFFIILCTSGALSGQNLVINGSFERQTPHSPGAARASLSTCQWSSSSAVWNTNAEGWRTFEVQTPDLLLRDSVAACPGFPRPRKGKRMAGLIMYHPFQDGKFAFDYHELIQGTLAKPLEKGKTYRISYWVYTNDSLGAQHLNAVYGRTAKIRPTFCGNFGFWFSENQITTRENFMESQVDFAVKPQLNTPEIIETKGGWRKISLAYTPDKSGYQYFLFGNFFFDAVTAINMSDEERMQLDQRNQDLEFWKKTQRIAYYLFDDFSIVADADARIEQSLLMDRQYTFQDALLFDFGKSDLRPEAVGAIEKLANVILKNQFLRYEIGGHTDNVGEDAANFELSEKRALAVYKALTDKGIDPNQLSWKGYGKTKPVAENTTDAGRQQNRRVECRVLD